MTREKWLISTVVVLLVSATAAVLARIGSSHQLGAPGVKMVAKTVFGPGGIVVNTNTVDLPLRVLNYTSEQLEVTQDELDWLPKDTTYGRRLYTSFVPETNQVLVSVVMMGTDRTSIHKPQICLEGQGWKIDSSELTTIRIANPFAYDLPVMKIAARKPVRGANGEAALKRAIFAYWFVADHRLTARHAERMWWMARDLMSTGVLPRWAYVTYWSVCDPGQEMPAFDKMKQFIAVSVPEFQLVTGPQIREVTANRVGNE